MPGVALLYFARAVQRYLAVHLVLQPSQTEYDQKHYVLIEQRKFVHNPLVSFDNSAENEESALIQKQRQNFTHLRKRLTGKRRQICS
uniref:Putative secreted protein n=1 Tax=Anopheles triannulatus TaxID=58253 RepID=A0A2M4B7M6_9DIPT